RLVAPTAVGAPDRAADAIAEVVGAALGEAGAGPADVAALGIGVPGRVDRDRGHVTLAVNLDWHDLPLGPRLEARLGIPTVLENDVRAAALGLSRRRVFGEVESLALLAVGTGISAGVVIDGRLHRGSLGLAGEIGHAVIDPGGPRCACGMTGCFEAVAAGPAIAARAGTPDAESAFAAAAAGDPRALAVVDETGRAVAWGVHLLALAYDVDRIVIGGGVSHAGEPFIAPVIRELDRFRVASPLAREILVPGLVQLLPPGADAGAWGAVTIAREYLSDVAGELSSADAPRREVGHA
ncbi:MAG: ROK family protein, partial [Chloroflexi bacterium]|nr:ROK family protein [Chloroflexota bacterium]